MRRKRKSWLFRYHGFQSSAGSSQLFVWMIILIIGYIIVIWTAKLFDWLEEKLFKPIDDRLIKIFGEDWGIIFTMIVFFVVLPTGINLYRHGLNFKKWT